MSYKKHIECSNYANSTPLWFLYFHCRHFSVLQRFWSSPPVHHTISIPQQYIIMRMKEQQVYLSSPFSNTLFLPNVCAWHDCRWDSHTYKVWRGLIGYLSVSPYSIQSWYSQLVSWMKSAISYEYCLLMEWELMRFGTRYSILNKKVVTSILMKLIEWRCVFCLSVRVETLI